MSYLSEWYDLVAYLKQTTNARILRSILISSFTIGLPQFTLEIKQENLVLRRAGDEEIEPYLNKVDYAEIRENQSKFVSASMVQNVFAENKANSANSLKSQRMKNEPGKSRSPISHSQNSYVISILSKSTKPTFDYCEVYEEMVDSLLDLSDVYDMALNNDTDSANLLFASRAIILIDLMKNLEDKYFLENFAYPLCLIVDSAITQVLKFYRFSFSL